MVATGHDRGQVRNWLETKPPSEEGGLIVRLSLVQLQPQGLCNTFAVGRIDLEEQRYLAALDGFRHTRHVAGDVLVKTLALRFVEQVEQRGRLAVVIVVHAVVPVVGGTLQRQRRLESGCSCHWLKLFGS